MNSEDENTTSIEIRARLSVSIEKLVIINKTTMNCNLWSSRAENQIDVLLIDMVKKVHTTSV